MPEPKNQTYVIVHGHFYQPPRENPWTGAIEPQPSAAPYRDWNARVTAECYTPNTRSRVLDGRGRVLDVVNNFKHISFNFGPTLLAYLEQHHPETYRRILQADLESLSARGHGNATAQAYNHVILPLASARDRWTQIVWGLEDFRARFRRPSDGLWLPETAVNQDTLEDVIRAGVRFLLLAPSQASAIRPIGSDRWQEVSAGNIPTERSYLCRGGRGEIQVLFYHAGVSRGVAFEHLLRNAATFAERISGVAAETAACAEDRLILVCTDGESYGHHEPMGDMCLAYLATRELPARGLILTNPATFLDGHPPAWEVRLKPGEGTAWSCTHGVGRWKEDCGCSGGGPPSWNQGWRAPLRRALDRLRECLDPLFEQQCGKLLDHPWKARDDYIQVVLDRSRGASESFFARHACASLDDRGRAEIYRLMEMQRNAMLMYTSCGWFFADLAGIEAVANLRFAARASELGRMAALTPIDTGFREELVRARSNVLAAGDGLRILERSVLPSSLPPEKVAAHQAFLALAEPLSATCSLYRFRIEIHKQFSERRGNRSARALILTVANDFTGEGGKFVAVLLSGGGLRLRALVRGCRPECESVDLAEILATGAELGFEEALRLLRTRFDHSFGLDDMLPELREHVLQAALAPLLRELGESFEQTFIRHEDLLGIVADLEVGLPLELQLLAGYAGSLRFNRLIERGLASGDLDEAFSFAAFLDKLGAALDRQTASRLVAERLATWLEDLLARPTLTSVGSFIRLLQNARETRLEVNEAGLQDVLAARLRETIARAADQEQTDEFVQRLIEALLELAGHLNLNTDSWRTWIDRSPGKD